MLILDGNSEMVRMFGMKYQLDMLNYFQKRPAFLPMFVTCSKLPSYISPMGVMFFCNINLQIAKWDPNLFLIWFTPGKQGGKKLNNSVIEKGNNAKNIRKKVFE